MQVDHLFLDKSGDLVSGIFYEFQVLWDDEPPAGRSHPNKGLASYRSPTRDELFIAGEELWMSAVRDFEKAAKRIEHHRCQSVPEHVTEWYCTNLYYKLEEGSRISDFIPDTSQESHVLVTDSFAKRLRDSGLAGIGLEKVAISENKVAPKAPQLWVLHFQGRNCQRPLSVRGAPNACPHCGHEPLICQDCGYKYSFCPRCEKEGWTVRNYHKGNDDRRLVVSPPEQRYPQILEAAIWDGTDFIYGRRASEQFITRRALDWLLSVHAAPFYAFPVLANLKGLSKEQAAKVEAARKPISPPVE